MNICCRKQWILFISLLIVGQLVAGDIFNAIDSRDRDFIDSYIANYPENILIVSKPKPGSLWIRLVPSLHFNERRVERKVSNPGVRFFLYRSGNSAEHLIIFQPIPILEWLKRVKEILRQDIDVLIFYVLGFMVVGIFLRSIDRSIINKVIERIIAPERPLRKVH